MAAPPREGKLGSRPTRGAGACRGLEGPGAAGKMHRLQPWTCPTPWETLQPRGSGAASLRDTGPTVKVGVSAVCAGCRGQELSWRPGTEGLPEGPTPGAEPKGQLSRQKRPDASGGWPPSNPAGTKGGHGARGHGGPQPRPGAGASVRQRRPSSRCTRMGRGERSINDQICV